VKDQHVLTPSCGHLTCYGRSLFRMRSWSGACSPVSAAEERGLSPSDKPSAFTKRTTRMCKLCPGMWRAMEDISSQTRRPGRV